MRPRPPIRPARPRARTRTCRMDPAGWCGAASPPWPSGLRIEPGWRAERRHERAALDFGAAHAAHQQIAVLVEVAPHALLGREPRQIISRDLAESTLVPAVEVGHEMPGET